MTELQTIHRDIQELLDEASIYDTDARECRRYAGRLLIRARAMAHTGESWLPPGMDGQSAEMLIRMAAGGRVAGD